MINKSSQELNISCFLAVGSALPGFVSVQGLSKARQQAIKHRILNSKYQKA